MNSVAHYWPQVASREGERHRLSVVPLLRMPTPPTDLEARAAFLWPHDPALAAKWVRAVGVVRSTNVGWIVDPGNTRAVSWHA